ncbi:MAG: hypothetical protein ACE5IB_07410 [Candidatus Geothermarchaeales archaeon]
MNPARNCSRGHRATTIRVYRADTGDIFVEAETKGGLQVTSLPQTIADLAFLGDAGRDVVAELLTQLTRHE